MREKKKSACPSHDVLVQSAGDLLPNWQQKLITKHLKECYECEQFEADERKGWVQPKLEAEVEDYVEAARAKREAKRNGTWKPTKPAPQPEPSDWEKYYNW